MSERQALKQHYDLVVVGGGVHGAAAALEASRLGYGVLLLEQNDFGSGTSANSLKIIHGGLRYLQSLDLRRSRESAREQSRLLKLVPHLVQLLPCVIGTDHSLARSASAMRLGLWFYEHLVRSGLPEHPRGGVLTTAEADTLTGHMLFDASSGAALWYDARVLDSERLVLTYLKTAERLGAQVLNYTAAVRIHRDDELIVDIQDSFTGSEATVTTGTVVDTGSFLRRHSSWARGVNLVLNRPWKDYAVGLRLNGGAGDSGRLFFVTPGGEGLVVGTWYFPHRPDMPDRLTRSELQRCLADVRQLLPALDITETDISRVQVGELPVEDETRPLSLLEHPEIEPVEGDKRLLSVTGVKFTTARPTVKRALKIAGLYRKRPALDVDEWYGSTRSTEQLSIALQERLSRRLDDATAEAVARRLSTQYGAVAMDIIDGSAGRQAAFELIPGYDAIQGEIHHCVDQEYCRTPADFLIRRSGLGRSIEPPANAVEYCARIMADRLGWDESRLNAGIEAVASHYLHALSRR